MKWLTNSGIYKIELTACFPDVRPVKSISGIRLDTGIGYLNMPDYVTNRINGASTIE
jgi:hypothetical protein